MTALLELNSCISLFEYGYYKIAAADIRNNIKIIFVAMDSVHKTKSKHYKCL